MSTRWRPSFFMDAGGGVMESTVRGACGKISAARTNREVRRLLDGLLCDELGWDYYIYVAHVPTRFVWNREAPQGLMITNYPVGWLFQYLRKGFYRFDPLITHCQTHNLGLVWSTAPQEWANFSAESQDIAAAARREGWAGGVAIPIPAVPCRGSFVLVSKKPLESIASQVDVAMAVGATIGLHIHDALLEIALDKSFSTLDRSQLYLTNIEKDILQWTADGMPGKQVAAQLGISPKAVERHLEKVRERLKAPNRAKMMVMGVALGLIETGRAWVHGSIINAEGYEERLEKVCEGRVEVPEELAHDFLCGEAESAGRDCDTAGD